MYWGGGVLRGGINVLRGGINVLRGVLMYWGGIEGGY